MNLFKYKDKAFAYLFKNRPRKMPISENSPIDRENRGAYLCPCAMKRECGPLAQLGERLHGMEEVVGSIPIRSTKLNGGRTTVVEVFLYNGTFGLKLDASYLFRHQTKKADQ